MSKTTPGAIFWRGIIVPQAMHVVYGGQRGRETRFVPVFISGDPVHVLPGGTWVRDLHGRAEVVPYQKGEK